MSIKAGEVHIGGPPLLFATDIRMTILVTLALADGPIRQKNLWKHIGKSSKTALYPLVKYGIVAMWGNSRSCQCVALDPCHPAADALRSLLLAIAKNFDGFSKPSYAVDDRDAGDVPSRPRRLRDVRNTFGDRFRTLALLCVYLRGEITGIDVGRIMPRFNNHTARDVLWMYRAFGILTMSYVVRGKRRAYVFQFNESNVLVPFIRAVLAALDTAMPMWRIREQRQRTQPVPKRKDSRRPRRKPGSWKW